MTLRRYHTGKDYLAGACVETPSGEEGYAHAGNESLSEVCLPAFCELDIF